MISHIVIAALCLGGVPAEDYARYVDVFTGTAATGHTTPAAAMPFGMVQAGPDSGNRNWAYCSGYQFFDQCVIGYSQTHLSGTGCTDMGDVQILPFTGEYSVRPSHRSVDKRQERGEPGYYTTIQDKDALKVEITATKHVGYYRITSLQGRPIKVLVDPNFGCRAGLNMHKDCDVTSDISVVGTISGSYTRSSWVQNRPTFYRIAFNRPWKSIAKQLPCSGEKQPVYLAEFGPDELLVRVALSQTSCDKAASNMEFETKGVDFDTVRANARAAWNALFARSTVEGTELQKKNWYTSLYHLYFQPNDFSDVGEEPRFTTLSLWDTFRAAQPWYTLIVPEIVCPEIRSMLRLYRKHGLFPRMSYGGGYVDCMIGEHALPMIADSYLKGFRDFDVREALDAMVKTVTVPHKGRAKENWDLYAKHGYLPFDLVKYESCSRTLETSYDDWCLAKFADAIGESDIAAKFYKRADNWKNIFDPSTGFARGKDSKGKWIEPFDPFQFGHENNVVACFTEGNSFQYSWHVLHDVPGLVAAMGGRETTLRRLDSLFTANATTEGASVDVTGLIGQYVHGNEPSHHIIYFYPQLGHPEKAAERVRDVFDRFYFPGPCGLSGNDDCGQMSAWYVFSAFGFYPFNPCGGEYVIGAPQVPQATLTFANGKTFKMTAKNLSKENKYVKSVRLNGKPITDWKLRHSDILAGGELVFEMEMRSANGPAMTWKGNPISWITNGQTIEARSATGFIKAVDFKRGRKMSVTAEVTPKAVATNNHQFATIGVACYEKPGHFWHLALVRSPTEKGGKRVFELGEGNGGKWPSQRFDILKALPGGCKRGEWEYGKTYRLELNLVDGRIEGSVKTADGNLIFRCGYALKESAVRCGAPALHATGGFSATVNSVQAETSECVPDDLDVPPEFPAYQNGPRPISDRVYKATGFFRVEKGDGDRWRAIDPNGREIVPIGVNTVRYDGCGTRGPIRRYHEWNKTHYPNREAWELETLNRLKSWGFNRLSGGDVALYRRGFMHSRNLSVGTQMCSPSMPQEYWICPNPGKPCAAFPNVFHPKFRAWCDYLAALHCAPNRNDPWLFGYYTDNELAWWGRGSHDVGLGLYDEALKLPPEHTARQALVRFAREHGCSEPAKATNELKLQFLRLVAEIYFRETSAAIRAADPNHLVMGARFAGLGGAHPAVWEIAGKYCDLVTFNIYPWADLDRNVVVMNKAKDAPRVADAFAERYAVTGKPFLITEWSFPALDSGLPCMCGAGQRFLTQAERTQATELFARTMLNAPSVLGYDYFMWVDEPPEGVSDTHPEDTNYGLVSEQGRPYPLTEMFARLHADINGVRAAGMPKERPAPPKPVAPTANEMRAKLVGRASSPCAIVFPQPKVGKGPVMKNIATADGKTLGDFTMMLCSMLNGNRTWTTTTSVRRVKALGENRWLVDCVGSGRQGTRFAIAIDVTIAAERGRSANVAESSCLLVDVVTIRNEGKAPLEVKNVYFRTDAPYAAENTYKRPTKLWKRPSEARWQAPDGRWIGARSTAATAGSFSFGYDAVRKSQHPDASFEPLEPLTLAPNAEYRPSGTMWCIIEAGVKR